MQKAEDDAFVLTVVEAEAVYAEQVAKEKTEPEAKAPLQKTLEVTAVVNARQEAARKEAKERAAAKAKQKATETAAAKARQEAEQKKAAKAAKTKQGLVAFVRHKAALEKTAEVAFVVDGGAETGEAICAVDNYD